MKKIIAALCVSITMVSACTKVSGPAPEPVENRRVYIYIEAQNIDDKDPIVSRVIVSK